MKKRTIISACLFALLIISGTRACECLSNYVTKLDLDAALSDSLNAGYVNDTAAMYQLRDSISRSALCFMATIKELRPAGGASVLSETLFVTRDSVIKGSSVPAAFTFINFYGGPDCAVSALPLVGRKLLCILPQDKTPATVADLGVNINLCLGVSAGIFVTKSRIVKAVFRSAKVSGIYWTYAQSMSRQNLFDETSSRMPMVNRNNNYPAGIAQSRFGAFMLNGRAIGAKNARTISASHVIIKDGNKTVGIGKKELR